MMLKNAVIARYPHLFKGLGCLQGAYHTKLQGDTRPFALTNPMRVAVPLKSKVQAELERMDTLGVTSKVEEATDWCASMVVVPMADG